MTHLRVLATGIALRRRAITVVAALALVAGMPAAAAADPSPFSCASARTAFYVMDLPVGYWPAGKNGVEYILTFVAADGSSFTNHGLHYFSVADNSTAYRGNVLIRLFNNWGVAPDGSVDFDVQRILPSQPTSLLVQEIVDTGTDTSRDTLVARTKRNGQWGAWMNITQGPQTSACEPGGNMHWGGLFWERHGWQ
jgi:hypothetical protein